MTALFEITDPFASVFGKDRGPIQDELSVMWSKATSGKVHEQGIELVARHEKVMLGENFYAVIKLLNESAPYYIKPDEDVTQFPHVTRLLSYLVLYQQTSPAQRVVYNMYRLCELFGIPIPPSQVTDAIKDGAWKNTTPEIRKHLTKAELPLTHSEYWDAKHARGLFLIMAGSWLYRYNDQILKNKNLSVFSLKRDHWESVAFSFYGLDGEISDPRGIKKLNELHEKYRPQTGPVTRGRIEVIR